MIRFPGKRMGRLGAALLFLLSAGPASAGPACTGDCDADGAVTVDELLTGVRLALGDPLDRCASFDTNADLSVTVEEVTAAVANALTGCRAAAADDFDGFRAEDVTFLASDELDGRDNHSPGSLAAQQYLIDQIRGFAVGLNDRKTGDDAFKQSFPDGTNILGVIRGHAEPEEYVIVGAHYDHFGGCNGVCNGATDNVAGVAAVLAIAREIADNPQPLRRSVVLAFWDAEEDGLLGSQFYTRNPIVPLARTVAYVNFDIQGANLLPSLRRITFAIGAETGGPRLLELLGDAIDGVDLDPLRVTAIFGQGRSDYFHFINARVPTVFFSDSTGPCYHTTRDDEEVVDLGKLAKQSEIGAKLVESLAQSAERPSYIRSTVVYEDAVAIDHVLERAMPDLSLFSQEDQEFVLGLSAQLSAVVAEGESDFDGQDVNVLAAGVLRVIDILTDQPCDGFLESGAAATAAEIPRPARDERHAHDHGDERLAASWDELSK